MDPLTTPVVGRAGGSTAPSTTEAPNTAGTQASSDCIVLEEEIDPNYVPTDEEVLEYAKWLGMDPEKDKELFWIAREGLKAPLPPEWKPCKTQDTEEIYYFNFSTGESSWDHPCDEYYRKVVDDNRKKIEAARVSTEAQKEERRRAKKEAKMLKAAQAAAAAQPGGEATKTATATAAPPTDSNPLQAPPALTAVAASSKKGGALKAAVAAASPDADPSEVANRKIGGGASAVASTEESTGVGQQATLGQKLDRKPLPKLNPGGSRSSSPALMSDDDEPAGAPPPAPAVTPAASAVPAVEKDPLAATISGGNPNSNSGKKSSFASKKFGRGLNAALSSSGGSDNNANGDSESGSGSSSNGGSPLGATLMAGTLCNDNAAEG